MIREYSRKEASSTISNISGSLYWLADLEKRLDLRTEGPIVISPEEDSDLIFSDRLLGASLRSHSSPHQQSISSKQDQELANCHALSRSVSSVSVIRIPLLHPAIYPESLPSRARRYDGKPTRRAYWSLPIESLIYASLQGPRVFLRRRPSSPYSN